jgi:uncharacterized membrane protein YagU involved in acid resistance
VIGVIALLVFSSLFAVVYGVVFSEIYTKVELDAGVVALFALLGCTTYLIMLGIWKIIKPLVAPSRASDHPTENKA